MGKNGQSSLETRLPVRLLWGQGLRKSAISFWFVGFFFFDFFFSLVFEKLFLTEISSDQRS